MNVFLSNLDMLVNVEASNVRMCGVGMTHHLVI